MEYEIKRTDSEIDNLRNECAEAVSAGKTKFSGAGYEAGIQAVLDWLFGDTDDAPLDD